MNHDVLRTGRPTAPGGTALLHVHAIEPQARTLLAPAPGVGGMEFKFGDVLTTWHLRDEDRSIARRKPGKQGDGRAFAVEAAVARAGNQAGSAALGQGEFKVIEGEVRGRVNVNLQERLTAYAHFSARNRNGDGNRRY